MAKTGATDYEKHLMPTTREDEPFTSLSPWDLYSFSIRDATNSAPLCALFPFLFVAEVITLEWPFYSKIPPEFVSISISLDRMYN